MSDQTLVSRLVHNLQPLLAHEQVHDMHAVACSKNPKKCICCESPCLDYGAHTQYVGCRTRLRKQKYHLAEDVKHPGSPPVIAGPAD